MDDKEVQKRIKLVDTASFTVNFQKKNKKRTELKTNFKIYYSLEL